MSFKIFISSRNNDKVIIGGIEGDTLTDIRRYLKRELENIKFLGKDFFEIKINEDFGATASTDSYNKCLEEVKDSDFFIALYNGAAGWAPAGIDLGICLAEYDTAINISSEKVTMVDVRKFFTIVPKDKNEADRNSKFQKYLNDLNAFNNPLKVSVGKMNNDGFKEELLASFQNVIYKHILERIKLSNRYYDFEGNNKISLNWKKMKYDDRNDEIVKILSNLISTNLDYKIFETKVYSIPDNMSVEDAKSYTGRPFLKDQDIIQITKAGTIKKKGPVHFIGVYGTASEIQVKNLIGFPDVSTIKDVFGIYVWEQNTHSQLVFLTECKTPEALKSKFLLFCNWSRSKGEYDNICKRAEARSHILKSILDAKKIAPI